MSSYDAIVVGAGPAGSTAARLLARDGARVLMLDKALFPRDKPCGGGVTFRADAANDLDLSPVTEREIYGGRFSADLKRPFSRTNDLLLARMTQRSRLDAYLAEQAVAAGVEFRDEVGADGVEVDHGRTSVRMGADVHDAPLLIGADGVNGLTSRALGLQPTGEHAVALEARYPTDDALATEWEHAIGLDLGGTPGGYCWVFPKGDHLNIGVGGWTAIGPELRTRLDDYTRFVGLDPARLEGHRGYRLPLRREGEAVVRKNAMLVGDAAALVDPLSGEGIWAAFVSGRLAAEEGAKYLSGAIGNVTGYQRALERVMHEEIIASRRLMAMLQRLPPMAVMVMKHYDPLWRALVQIIRGDLTYPELLARLGPLRHATNFWADREIALHERTRTPQRS